MSGPAQYYGASLLRNLYAGLRLALFLPLRAFDYRVSPLHYTLLVAFNFAMWVLAAGARVGFEGDFEPTSVVVYLATVPLVLLAALLVAMAYGTLGELVLIAIALSASDLVFEVVSFLLAGIGAASGLSETMVLAFFIWMWVVSIRAVAVCCGMRRPQFYQGALAVSAMIAIVFFLFPKADVWLPQEAQAAAGTPITEERIFHLQGELLERSLAAIKPGTPRKPELYFVGFAPDSSQDVFLHEMRFVKRLFDERFGAAGRSIALVSSQDALEEFPIATVTSLGRALRRVGEVMNADDDVLFLFLSAHGDRSHRLSASQPPLELTPLTPTALARMLQDSGIKWRVVVVSACYSGGFIEPLRDDNSVVITAAAPDRTSFGCEAGRDFTYFGQAYFRDALSQTRSFIKAFELAKEIVAKEEAAERLRPSLPQMWVGRSIAERLKDPAQQPNQK